MTLLKPSLFIAAVFLIACFATACTQTIAYRCPPLSPVPLSTLDALEAQSRKDRDTGPWVVDLNKHYQKCEALTNQ